MKSKKVKAREREKIDTFAVLILLNALNYLVEKSQQRECKCHEL